MISASEFLKHYEDVNPLPTHESFYDDWADEAKELWDLQIGDSDRYLKSVLELRKDLLIASMNTQVVPDDTWKWLITTKQVEQRTAEWYQETKNILTASEIGSLWKGPLSRASLVKSKIITPEEPVAVKRSLAFKRSETGPMDWGVRYEPVVKKILEDKMGAKIHDLGRIRHRTLDRIAASPDGLIVEARDPAMVGSLVEIKCPPSRVINDKIPIGYWYQMQLQMEVCDRPSCEYVEVKFRDLDDNEEPEKDAEVGWITLESNVDTMELRYAYTENPPVQEGWIVLEKYRWVVQQFRQIKVPRDSVWFQKIQPDLEKFWKDVEDARSGTWVPPPSRKVSKKEVSSCAIVDSEGEAPNTLNS